jgi:hypothetical protein
MTPDTYVVITPGADGHPDRVALMTMDRDEAVTEAKLLSSYHPFVFLGRLDTLVIALPTSKET